MNFADLEDFADRLLRQLPTPGAPPALLPRVLAAVRQWPEGPWYTRAWFTWHRGWQAAALAGLAAMVAGAYVLLPDVNAAIAQSASPLAGRVEHATANAAASLAVVADVVQVVWGTLLQPLAGYALPVVALMCFACVVFGMALNQVVLGRMSER